MIVSRSPGVNVSLQTCVLNGKSGDDILPEFTNFYTNVFKPNTVDNNNVSNRTGQSVIYTHAYQALFCFLDRYCRFDNFDTSS